MPQNKIVFLFLIKAVLFFCVLAIPWSIYDKVYGNFYRGIANTVFNKFHKTGFAKFTPAKPAYMTHVEVGNRKPSTNVAVSNVAADFNTRYRGYIPTAFLISLILASPVKTKRKIVSLFTGIFILTIVIMIKQWIHLLYMCDQGTWLMLYDFTPAQKEKILWWYLNFANYSGSTLIIVIAVWILVSFRKNDLELLTS